MQGWRVEMEDAHVAVLELPGALSTWSFFGVFDGHAGAQVSSHCASNLLRHILDTPVFKDMVASSEKQHSIDEIKAAIVEGFLAFDASLLHDNPSEKSGSTAVVAFVTPKHIYFANCGDSRGILLRNSSPSFATEDHKPSSPGERRRINNAGGHVILSRVNGSLAVSRALGDFDYKQVKGTPPSDQLVSPEPDVTCLERMPEADQILCLACDGIWDVYSNEELCDYVLHRLKCSSSLTHVCNEVLDTSLFKGSKDNMSILLVGLNKLPEVDPEIVRQDEELEASIRQIIESLRANILNCATGLRKRRHQQTLPIEEEKGLRSLRSDDSIVVVSADKGGATVIMDEADYVNKANQAFNDREAYTPVAEDLTKKQTASIKKVNELTRKKLINPADSKFLTSNDTRIAYAYSLPKVHKADAPLRIIVPLIGSPTYNLAKWLYKHLKHLTNGWQYSTNNCHAFL
ncbi:Protein phosphatase 1B [Sparganum proliferum]